MKAFRLKQSALFALLWLGQSALAQNLATSRVSELSVVAPSAVEESALVEPSAPSLEPNPTQETSPENASLVESVINKLEPLPDTVESLLPETLIPESVPTANKPLIAQAEDLKIGFINFRTIMVHAPQNDAIRTILEQEFKDEHKALLQEQQTLSQLEQQLLSLDNQDPQYPTLERQIISKRRELAKRDNEYRDRYSLRRNEEAAKVQNLVLNEIIAVAEESGFDVILNDTGVVYVSERADLTQLVLKRLKQKSTE